MRTTTLFAAFVMLLIASPAMHAQTPTSGPARAGSDGPDRSGYRPSVIRLKAADAFNVSNALEEVFGEYIFTAIESPAAVLVSAPPDRLGEIRALIGELDVSESAQRPFEVEFMPIANRDPSELASQLNQTLGGPGVAFSADRSRGVIVGRAGPDVLKAARSLVEQLDTPPQSARLEFAFFHAGAAEPQGAAAIPDELAPVVGELERFGHVRLLGQLSTSVIERSDFRLQGQVDRGYEIEIKGVLLGDARGDMKKLHIEATANLASRAGADGKSPGRAFYRVETTLLARPGVLTALGAAPCGNSPGDTGVLVVRLQL